MATLRITQVKSTNGTNPRQKGALRSLGLGRIGKTSERTDDPSVIGAVRSVQHLIKVEEV
jgi:large subunit ribosomal protein L30